MSVLGECKVDLDASAITELAVPQEPPLKRKRGRPRKDASILSASRGRNASAELISPQAERTSMKERRERKPVDKFNPAAGRKKRAPRMRSVKKEAREGSERSDGDEGSIVLSQVSNTNNIASNLRSLNGHMQVFNKQFKEFTQLMSRIANGLEQQKSK